MAATVKQDGRHTNAASGIAPRRPAQRNGETVRWRVNWPLAAGTIVAVLIIAPAAHFWHSHQVSKNGSVLLERAGDLEKSERWFDALGYVQRYLKLYPEDVAARIRLAEVYDHLADQSPAKIPAAERLYSVAVGLAPDRPDLRLRHAERLIELGRYQIAREEATEALRLEPGSSRALRLRAIAAAGDARARGDFSAVDQLVEMYRAALTAAARTPEHVELSMQLAHMYRRDFKTPAETERSALADKIIDDMVAAGADRSSAWTARYQYQLKFCGHGADADLDRALELDEPHHDFAAQMAAAERANERKDLEGSQRYYRQAIEAQPTSAAAYLGLAEVHAAEPNHPAAVIVLKEGVGRVTASDQHILLELTLARELLAAGELAEADQVLTKAAGRIEALASRSTARSVSQFRSALGALRAGWHMAREEYSLAAGLLRRALVDKPTAFDAREAAARAQSYMQLGRCYAALRHWDQAATAFKEAAALTPQDMSPHLAVAQAWQSAGRLDEAIRELKLAAAMPNSTVSIWALLVEVLLRQQVTMPPDQQSWDAVAGTLAKAQKQFPDAAPLKALAVELSDLRSGAGETIDLLAKMHAQDPQSADIAGRLLLAYQSSGQATAADELLERFTSEAKDPTDALMLRSTLMIAREQYAEARQLLESHLAQVPERRVADVQLRLAMLAMKLKQPERARQILTSLASGEKRSELLVELVASLALEERDLSELEHWEQVLRDLEGPDGTGWRFYRAQRFLAAARDVADPELKQAEQLAVEIQHLRPLWPTAFVLQGQIAARRGQSQRAIDAYHRALELGDRRPLVSESLVGLLYAQGDMDQAEKELMALGTAVNRSPRLARIAIAIKNRRGDSESATALARRQVNERPDDPMSHIVLGQALRKSGDSAAALASFQQAAKVAPNDLRSWQALFGYQLERGDRDAAREALTSLTKSVELPERDMLLIVAQDEILLGDAEAAARSFQKLLVVAPDDVQVLRRAAQFFADRDPALAEKCLRHACEQQTTSVELRRELAEFLIARGRESDLQEAGKYLAAELSSASPAPAAHSLQARLLLRRGTGDDREQARQLLEELLVRRQATDVDRSNLMVLYEAEGRLRKVQELAYDLVNRNDPRPEHLARYVDLLLRENRAAEAAPWLQKLLLAAPQSLSAISLQARMLAAQGKSDEIEPLVTAFLAQHLAAANSAGDRLRVQTAVAQLYEAVHLDAPAERTLREVAAENATGYAALAVWLAQHDRTAEAVDLCLQSSTADTSSTAAVALAKCLTLGNTTTELSARAEPVLAAAELRLAKDAEFLFALANWRLIEGRSADAVPILRRALEVEPRHPLIMNNLAFALADEPATRSEARALIDQALSLGGSLPDLLSTKGTICLLDGDAPAAVRLFQEATSRSTPDPRYLMNLALALKQAGKMSEAKAALRQADERSLESAVLSKKQKNLLAALRHDLAG